MRKSSRNSMKPTYSCTACRNPIKSTYEANLHPLIATLICRKCFNTYGSGDFAQAWPDGIDEFGDDNYCRWCCDGGELYGCMNETEDKQRCHYSFCRDCIEHNVPEDIVLDEELGKETKWLCYACDPKLLEKLCKEARAAIRELAERETRRSESPLPTKRRRTSQSPSSVSNGVSSSTRNVSTRASEPTPAKPTTVEKPAITKTSTTKTNISGSAETPTSTATKLPTVEKPAAPKTAIPIPISTPASSSTKPTTLEKPTTPKVTISFSNTPSTAEKSATPKTATPACNTVKLATGEKPSTQKTVISAPLATSASNTIKTTPVEKPAIPKTATPTTAAIKLTTLEKPATPKSAAPANTAIPKAATPAGIETLKTATKPASVDKPANLKIATSASATGESNIVATTKNIKKFDVITRKITNVETIVSAPVVTPRHDILPGFIENFRKNREQCLDEIKDKTDIVLEMQEAGAPDRVISKEIDSACKSMDHFKKLIASLRKGRGDYHLQDENSI